jgi:hypothetical protein
MPTSGLPSITVWSVTSSAAYSAELGHAYRHGILLGVLRSAMACVPDSDPILRFPFAQDRWGQDADLGHQILWPHRSEEFGRSYGVLIKGGECCSAPSWSLMTT